MAQRSALTEYRRKRDFARTAEPRGDGAAAPRTGTEPLFVVQLHDATAMHFDFRLEVDGVLRSWAVPKGPSADPGDKRLAMPTEDHPIEYREFEGVIAAGEYGAGPVIIWDEGRFRPLTEDFGAALDRGHASFELHGHKLRGAYALTRIRGREGDRGRPVWLLVKEGRAAGKRDAAQHPPIDPRRARSVRTGRTLRQLTAERPPLSRPDKVLIPSADGAAGITKAELDAYYRSVAVRLLPELKGRPLMLERHPDGLDGPRFMQKDLPDHVPDFVHRAELPKQGGIVRYPLCENEATLDWFADQACLTLHRWLSRADRPDHPDRMVLDLDPGGDGEDAFDAVKQAARWARELLEDELGLTTALMTTGSRGLHLVVPLNRRRSFDEIRAFARECAGKLADRHPDELTTAARKSARGDRLYLDTGRNAYGQTAVAPYSVRALPGAPVAVPISWEELEETGTARRWTLRDMTERLAAPDPWERLRSWAPRR